MSSRTRRFKYQPDGYPLTGRQLRQYERMRRIEELRERELLPESGASGLPVRKPRRAS